MKYEEIKKRIEEMTKNEPRDEFLGKRIGTCESIERLIVLLKLLAKEIHSPEQKKMVEGQLNQPYKNDFKSTRDTFDYLQSRWASLNEIFNIIVKIINGQSSKSVEENLLTIHKSTNTQNIFVVHGRNQKIRDGMFEFLRSIALQPIEWSKAMHLTEKSDPYIEEVLDKAFEHAQAIVVLFTPDDIAYLKEEFVQDKDESYEKEPTGQARLNVLFEAGMAKGRYPNNTVFVEIGKCKPFSDIGGKYLIKWDNSTEKRQILADALKRAGCNVDLSGTDWHTAGSSKLELKTSIEEKEYDEKLKDTLDENELKVLKAISSFENEGDKIVYVDRFAEKIEFSITKTKHILDNLAEKGFVDEVTSGDAFYLKRRGREYLIEKGIVE